MIASERRLSRGISRAKGGSRSRNAQNSYSDRGARSGRSSGRSGGRRPKKNGHFPIIIAAVALLGSAAAVYALSRNTGFFHEAETTVAETEYIDPNAIHEDLYLDYSAFKPGAELLNLKGMTKEQVVDFLKQSYSWHLVVKNGNPNLDSFSMPEFPKAEENKSEDGIDDQGTEEVVKVKNTLSDVSIRPSKTEFEIPDVLSDSITDFVDQIYTKYQEEKATESSTEESSTEKKKKKKKEEETTAESSTEIHADYILQLPDFSDKITDYVNQLAIVWKMSPKNGDITKYNKSTGEFEFGGSKDGYAVNVDDTAKGILTALNNKQFSSEITTEGEKIAASTASIKDQYKVIASFTTKTTSNELRNTNVRLSAEAVNGTVLQPGEEFSFNGVVGQRTAEKGYKAAAAYNQGEVVEEVGGGICQISSTLYNAVFRSGLTTTYRRSHTFAPNYVTPGTDATVSWPGPDYKFVNDSKHAIGIRAWYSNQTATVQIYGLPVLPEGVKWELESEKIKDLPVPAPQIITPQQGKESNGSAGSEWQAYKIITKNGKTEKVKDHYISYKGHTPKKYSASAVESSTAAESSKAESTAASSATETKANETKATESKSTESKSSETKATSKSSDSPIVSNDGPVGNNNVATTEEDVISGGPGA